MATLPADEEPRDFSDGRDGMPRGTAGSADGLHRRIIFLKTLLDSHSATMATLHNALIPAQDDIGPLQSTLNDTARNPASLSPFTAFFSDPMTASDGNAIQANLNALLAAVQRV